MIAGLIMAAALAATEAEPPKPAASPAPAATSGVSPVAVKPEEPKKVCVTEAQMGSHFKKKICATQAEWDRRRERDAAEMSKMSDRAASN